jgi:hypothetical protein
MPYHEHVRAPWWLWLSVVVWPAMLGLAYAAATTGTVGLAVAGGLASLALFGVWRYTLTITVDGSGLTVGRVRLEAAYLGVATALDREAARRVRGVDADPRAFVVLRGWVPTAVQLTVDDDRDPTPYWLVATRYPDALAAALASCREAATSSIDPGRTRG